MFININGIDVEILNFSESDYNRVKSVLRASLATLKQRIEMLSTKHLNQLYH